MEGGTAAAASGVQPTDAVSEPAPATVGATSVVPVVVLDVDGVLHPLNDQGMPLYACPMQLAKRFHMDEQLPHDDSQIAGVVPGEFLPSCMAELARILRITGAQIVLSTTWRETPSQRNAVDAQLVKHGMKPSIACTPRLSVLRGGRAAEILAWAQTQPQPDSPWVALDDIDLTQPARPGGAALSETNFVHVNPAKGLTRSDGDCAIALLLGPKSNCIGAPCTTT